LIESLHFSKHAYLSLEYSLLQEISSIAFDCLYKEFQKFKKKHQPIIDQPNGLYLAFCQDLINGGYLNLFKIYPALARLIAVRIGFWVGSSSEFILRLHKDIDSIQTFYFKDQKLGNAYLLLQSVGDQHDGGRSVVIIQFEQGQKIVYKPRNIDIYLAFNNFVAWINNNKEVKTKIITPKVLVKSGYGWVEYVYVPEDDHNKKYSHTFFYNIGFTIGYLYFLNSTDMHYSNVLVKDNKIIPIDLENIVDNPVRNHTLSERNVKVKKSTINSRIEGSVTRIGFLPRWKYDKDNEHNIYSSGFLFPAPNKAAFGKKTVNINLDTMIRLKATDPMPTNDLENIHPSFNLLTNITQGFKFAYNFLLKYRDELSSDTSPLKGFASVTSRSILRPTRMYFLMLKSMQTPIFMSNPIKKSLYLEALRNAALTNLSNKDPYWNINIQEINSMENADIPIFTAKACSTSLYVNKHLQVEKFFQASSLDFIYSTLGKLSKQDLLVQTKLLEQSLIARWAHEKKFNLKVSNKKIKKFKYNYNFDKELLLCINRIGKEVLNLYVPQKSDCAYWNGIIYRPRINRYIQDTLNPGLYDGSTGIVLFLVILDYIHNSNEYSQYIKSSLTGICKQTIHLYKNEDYVLDVGINGLGGILYGMAKIAQLNPDLQTQISIDQIMISIDIQKYISHPSVDIISGIAGLLLGLTYLYKIMPSSDLAVIIEQYAQKIANKSTDTQKGSKAWITINPRKPLTGFSHGVSGIAYALLCAGKVLNNKFFIKIALDGFSYERLVFSKKAHAWPDYRNSQEYYPHAWCHGSAGIGLSRIGAIKLGCTQEEIVDDLNHATENVINNDMNIQSLCCGLAGQIDFLLCDYECRGNEKSLLSAQAKIDNILSHYRIGKSFKLSSNYPNFGKYFNNLFLGNIGIGYAMIRYLYSKKIDSLLLFE